MDKRSDLDYPFSAVFKLTAKVYVSLLIVTAISWAIYWVVGRILSGQIYYQP